MEEIRTLPPLVRGKVTGFLDFFIDEVKIFRNILLLTDKCNIIVQVQWWGEKLPVYIIPQHFCSKQNEDTSYKFQNTYFHSATYKIKTKFDLFKSYLKTCEVLELAVLRAVENLVIGSAFMKDLIRLINNIHDPITLPLVDSSGKEIGEVKVHTNFSQGSCRVNKNEYVSQTIGNSITINNSRDIIKNGELTQNISSDCVSNSERLCERCSDDIKKRGIYKINQNFKVFQLKESQNEVTNEQLNFVKTSFNFGGNSKCESKTDQVSRSNEKCCSSKKILSNMQEGFSHTKKKLESKSFPQTQILSDCSKVLYFDLQGSKKLRNLKKNLKTEKLGLKNTDAYIVKGKRNQSKISEYPARLSAKPKSSVKKKICTENRKSVPFFKAPQKTLCEVHDENEKPPNKFIKTLPKATGQSHLNSQNSPVKDEGDRKILSYLLGYEMSKDDEQSALNDLRRASLSPNFVESFNQLCTSETCYQKSKINDNQKFNSQKLESQVKNVSKRINRLKFDLNNTIERNYFKKFFSSECSVYAFQIAEDLNTPKSDFRLENSGRVDIKNLNESSCCDTTSSENDLTKDSSKSVELQGGSNDLIVKDVSNIAASSFWSQERVPTDCSNCKYYKQFSELDTIIESLKHLDKKSIKRKDD